MTTRYVGAGGNNANDGLSWANRKLTLNGVEDTPVVAGDTVYVGPGTYRETLTVDVSGTAGNPITYIGDYTGANTDGTGGLVRISASDADLTSARATCITATSKDYRTFRGLTLDFASTAQVSLATACSNWIVEECYFGFGGGQKIYMDGTGTANTVRNCFIEGCRQNGTISIQVSHTSTVDDTGHVFENIIHIYGDDAFRVVRVGGITIRNCLFLGFTAACVRILTAPSVGQFVNVNNCVFHYGNQAVVSPSTGPLVEDYNTFSLNQTNRSNVSTGANSNTRPFLADTRWLHEITNGGTLVTPWSLASYCGLVELSSGTGAPATDLRGTSVKGSFREWGALEYDSAQAIAGGGGFLLSPIGASIIQSHWGGGQ